MFVIFMVIGVVGLVVMAVPAFGRHSHAHLHGPAHSHALSTPRAGGGSRTAALEVVPAEASLATRALRFVPSPRAVLSLCALYGAFGNVLVEAGLSLLIASGVAIVPALLVERLLVARLWELLLRSHAPPSAPLDALLFAEATAVTRFRNGRGIVAVVREGRLVQFSARLRADEAAFPVRVGESLRVEEVDASEERLTVSLLARPKNVTP